MLFNSLPFIFVFVPLLLAGFMILSLLDSRSASLRWIVVCSMTFYGLWAPINLAFVMGSMLFNYLLACQIRNCIKSEYSKEKMANLLLTIGIVANLCFLGYFKYKNFFVDNLNEVFGISLEITKVVLPLGISFITFQKIGFLIDVRSKVVRDFSLNNFFVFVFFFPQLIAGPIVHYREMMPQFDKFSLKLSSGNVVIGICLFSLGLFKKVILADGVAAYVPPGFLSAGQGVPVEFFVAWTSALAFTFQVYFDFSGYTDMALGLARIFGITLPMNFNSPLKASSIIEFWSRWHITLTRFLTAYIYTPLVIRLTRTRMRDGKTILATSASAVGAFFILVSWPTMLTMLISGLWHGAGFTYLLWGGIHGTLLIINHAWRQWRPKWPLIIYEKVMNPIGFVLTFISIVFTMVVFRASTVTESLGIYQGMLGLNGARVPIAILNQMGPLSEVFLSLGVTSDFSSGSNFVFSLLWILALFIIAMFAPNSMEIMRRVQPALYFNADIDHGNKLRFLASRKKAFIFSLSNRWAFCIALYFLLGVLGLSRPSEFLYWQF